MMYFSYKHHDFAICNNKPRNNEFERGQRYRLYYAGIDGSCNIGTSYTFPTVTQAIKFVINNVYVL